MLVRIACSRCRLECLWTDEPESFLSTVCRDPRRCQATLAAEEFRGLRSKLPECAADPRSAGRPAVEA